MKKKVLYCLFLFLFMILDIFSMSLSSSVGKTSIKPAVCNSDTFHTSGILHRCQTEKWIYKASSSMQVITVYTEF